MIEWRQKNKEHRKEYKRQWEAANPELYKASKKRDSARNSKAIVARVHKWKTDNPDKHSALSNRRRARELGAEGSYTGEQWTRLKEFYGNVCLCCGVHDSVKKLSVDHIIPLSKGGSHYITNIQPLCRPCNSSKHDKDTDYRQVCLLESAA
jgi:5-methylcytosine-specific restriction endonuclease McrA